MSQATMRASVLRAAGDLAVEDRPVPTPAPHEVLVRISSVGVCGSDVHYYEHGRIGRFEVTRPVLATRRPASSRGRCGGDEPASWGSRLPRARSPRPVLPQCLAGRYNLCEDMKFHATPPYDGPSRSTSCTTSCSPTGSPTR